MLILNSANDVPHAIQWQSNGKVVITTAKLVVMV